MAPRDFQTFGAFFHREVHIETAEPFLTTIIILKINPKPNHKRVKTFTQRKLQQGKRLL